MKHLILAAALALAIPAQATTMSDRDRVHVGCLR